MRYRIIKNGETFIVKTKDTGMVSLFDPWRTYHFAFHSIEDAIATVKRLAIKYGQNKIKLTISL